MGVPQEYPLAFPPGIDGILGWDWLSANAKKRAEFDVEGQPCARPTRCPVLKWRVVAHQTKAWCYGWTKKNPPPQHQGRCNVGSGKESSSETPHRDPSLVSSALCLRMIRLMSTTDCMYGAPRRAALP
eukprot:2808211-Rhodomonas_salina.2